MSLDESAHTYVERSDLQLAYDVEGKLVYDGKAQNNCEWNTIFWICNIDT